MIVYSKVLDSNSDFFLIKYLRCNKWLWNYKFFFDGLNLRQALILFKSIISRDIRVAFVRVEGTGHSWTYWRPSKLADITFGHMRGRRTIFYNVFFDEILKNKQLQTSFEKKDCSRLIQKICFISSNYVKIERVQKEHPDLFAQLEIFGEFNIPIERRSNIGQDRSADSLATCAKYVAALCIENNDEEGYFQGSALWSLWAMTPPILKAPRKWKNFIREDFIIDFDDYIAMTTQERIREVNRVQDRLLSGTSFLTSLTEDYLNFFRESFSGDCEPNLVKIAHQSQKFREKFIKV